MATKKHVWQIGDLCKQDTHHGIIYRVIDLEFRHDGEAKAMWIKPVLGLLTPVDAFRTHEVTVTTIELLTLVDLGLERLKLDNFLLGEARKYDGSPTAPTEEEPASDLEELVS
jgi:hypothetical protein